MRRQRPGDTARGKPLIAQLPPPGTLRWSAQMKAAVVVAIRAGTLSWEEACTRYMLSDTELASWDDAFKRDGIRGLLMKSRRAQTNR
jgi:hypothetical protein